MSLNANPFAGPSALNGSHEIFGRTAEVRKLTNLLISNRVLLFHSASGAGKSSLVEASGGLRTALAAEGFSVMTTLRVSRPLPNGYENCNRYELSLVRSVVDSLPPSIAREHNLDSVKTLVRLVSLVSEHPEIVATPDNGTILDSAASRAERNAPSDVVLIIDQFEETFTLDPTDNAAKADFFATLNQLNEMEKPPWVLLVMREDYLASLAPFRAAYPAMFRAYMRLEMLTKRQAVEILRNTFSNRSRELEESAISHVVAALATVQLESGGKVEAKLGDSIEPLLLQIVGHRIWSASTDELITETMVQKVELNAALGHYYENALDSIVGTDTNAQAAVRHWIQARLITLRGFRAQTILDLSGDDGIAPNNLDGLVDYCLVRRERIRGATWLELAHDRFVPAIIESNDVWFIEHRSAWVTRALSWKETSVGLLNHRACKTVERLISETKDPAQEAVLKEFLSASKAALQRRFNIRIGIAIATVLVAAILVTFGIGEVNANRDRHRSSLDVRAATKKRLESDVATLAQSYRSSVERVSLIVDLQRLQAAQAGLDAATQDLQRGCQLVAQDTLAESTKAIDYLPSLGVAELEGYPETCGARSRPYRIATLIRWYLDLNTQRGKLIAEYATPRSILAASTDGELIASGGRNGGIDIINLRSATRLAIPTIGEANIAGLAFSETSPLLFALDSSGRLQTADLAPWLNQVHGEVQATRLDGRYSNPRALALMSEDRAVIGGEGGRGVPSELRVWTVDGTDERLAVVGATTTSLAFLHKEQEQVLAVGHDAAFITLIDVNKNGRPTAISPLGMTSVESVAFDQTGAELAAGGREGIIETWRPDRERAWADGKYVKTGRILVSPSASNISSVLLPNDNVLVVGTEEGALYQFDRRTGRRASVLSGHTGRITSLASFQSTLYSAGTDGKIFSWSLLPRDNPQIIDARKTISTYCIEHECLASDFVPSAVAIDRMGNRLALGSYDGTIAILALNNFAVVSLIENAHVGRTRQASGVTRIEFSSDGKRLGSAGWDNRSVVWNLDSLGAVGEVRHRALVRDIAFNPNAPQMFVSASLDCTISVFDESTSKTTTKDFARVTGRCEGDDQANSLDFNSDGTKLLVARNRDFRIFDANDFAKDGEPVPVSFPPNKILDARFNARTDRIILAGTNGARATIALSNRALESLPLQSASIQRIELSARGTLLFSIDEKGEFRVTDLITNRDLFGMLLPFKSSQGDRERHWENNVVRDFDVDCSPDPERYSCTLASPLGTTGNIAMYDITLDLD